MKPLAGRCLIPLLVACVTAAGAQDFDALRIKQQAQAQARADFWPEPSRVAEQVQPLTAALAREEGFTSAFRREDRK